MSRRSYGNAPALELAPSGGLVLVVDDQADNRELMARYLESGGYRVQRADSGEAALRAIERERPDLILLDVMMPGDNGFEICRKLKHDPATLAIPIVLATGLQRRDDRIAGREAGADDFLSKPVFPEELLARVRSLVRLAEARQALEATRLSREVDERKRVHAAFERYVSPKLVKEILARSDSDSPLARLSRVEAVALFADIRGFTRMAEKLEPDVVVRLLNEFFTQATSVAYSFEGTVINMAGDSLLVAFGVPLPQADAALRAVQAAASMVRDFQVNAHDWKARYDLEVGLGIGIGRGIVTAGNVGSPSYMSYTLIGDAVNVAARLMQKAQADEVLLSESVLHGLGPEAGAFHATPLAPLLLKGKSAPLAVYRISPLG